jgi:hypothetical protein
LTGDVDQSILRSDFRSIEILHGTNQMKPQDYRKLLEEARAADLGIKLEVDNELDTWTARSLRRRLYLERDRARRQGDRSFDILSVCLRNVAPKDSRWAKWEVWIVRRDCVSNEPEDDFVTATASPLAPEETPRRIFARGPNRPRPFPTFSLHPDLP